MADGEKQRAGEAGVEIKAEQEKAEMTSLKPFLVSHSNPAAWRESWDSGLGI